MNRKSGLVHVVVLCVAVATAAAMAAAATGEEKLLRPDYYNSTCPDVESIVRNVVLEKLLQTLVTIPATLRLFFHDCFVEGCDASVIIASPENDAEKDASVNLSLAGDGFDTVIKAKIAVEQQCPAVVSCADILAIAARDVVVLSGGPNFVVELGRRDGLVSQAARVEGKLPMPDANVRQLTQMFRKNNLTTVDMISLSGAHTVGFSHCNQFANRLYNFSISSDQDPSMEPVYAGRLRQACPPNVDPIIAVNMDPYTPLKFDNFYYKNLLRGEGLFNSDAALASDQRTRPAVKKFAARQASFFKAFAAAMVRLGRVGVKTGTEGDIRIDCTAFNS